jgi:hypothetical protein
MISWSLTCVRSGGPRDFVRVFTDTDRPGWHGYIGELHLTPAEYIDLAARLAVPAPTTCARCGAPVPANEATHKTCSPVIQYLAGTLPSSEALGLLAPRQDVAELEPGEGEGPDIASASTDDRHHADPYTGDLCTMPDCWRPECVL